MNIKTITENDIIFGLVEKSTAATVTIYLSTDLYEENSPAIIAQSILYTELLLSGTKDLTRDQIQEELRLLGSHIDASFSTGKATLTITALNNKLKPTLDLLHQIILKPAFPANELRRAKMTLINQLELAAEDARGIAQAKLNNLFIAPEDNRHSHEPKQISASVTSINRDKLLEIHQMLLNNQWTVSIGANEACLKKVMETIKKLKKPYLSTLAKVPQTTSPTTEKQPKLLLHEVKSKQNLELSIGGYLPLNLQSPDLAAFQFGLAVLGKWGGFAGRLMSTVREKEGLTYGIYARTEALNRHQTGYWRIMTFFSPSDVKKGINSTLREVKTICQNGITTSEWQRFTNILQTGEKLTYDSIAGTTSLVHLTLLNGRSWNDYQEYRQRLYRCTKKEVNLALKKYLQPEQITISIAGPIAKAKEDLAAFL